MNLDTRNRLMHLVKLYQGSVNTSQVRVAEVFRAAIAITLPPSSWHTTIHLVVSLPAR